MERLRVSAKHLGELALPDCCPKCFHIKMKTGYRLPFQIFPGIFSSIDSYSKKITDQYYNRMGIVPPWLGIEGRPIKTPSLQQFQWFDEETGILLTGVPDSIIQKNDGSYVIVDYKTAKYTAGQDELLPLYEVQLNGYALIAEHVGLSPVSELLLVYYEPFTDIQTSTVHQYLVDGGFSMVFDSTCVSIGLDTEKVKQLMGKARELYYSELYNHAEGCKNASRIATMVSYL